MAYPVRLLIILFTPFLGLACALKPLEAEGLPPEAPRPAVNPGGSTAAEKESAKPSERPKILPLSSDCRARFEKIQVLADRVPSLFVDLKRSSSEIYDDMVQCSSLCNEFLSQCDGTAEAAEVRGTHVRMEVGRLARWQEEPSQKARSPEEREQAYKAHVEDLLNMARQAVKDSEAGSRARETALRLLIDLYNRTLQFTKVPYLGEQFVTEFPKSRQRPSIHLAVAGALLASGACAEAVAYLNKVIKDHVDDPEYVHYNEKLFDALTCVGDLEGMEDLMHVVRAEYPLRLPTLKEGHYLRNQYEQWLCMSPFWIGFVRMALGDVDGARKTFHDHIAEYVVRTEKMKKEGKPIGSGDICTITVDYRTRDMLDVLDNFYGKAPTNCFKLENFWVSEKKLDWKECQGKIVVAVFRSPGDVRAEKFLQEVNSLVKAHEKDGLLGITLAFRAGRPGEEADSKSMQDFRDDLKNLGVTLPAGFDPDDQGHKLFREVHATVGTASVVVFNRKGQISWFLADPRDMDRAILRRVIERMLAEKTAKG